MFLGNDLLPFLVLAFGGAMAVGTFLALVRPPEQRPSGSAKNGSQNQKIERAPIMRSVLFIVAGTVAAIWALASLISK